MPRVRLAILISGRGSNMRSLVAASREGRIAADVALVASNKADAPGLAWAREQGVATFVSPSKSRTREEHEGELMRAIDESGATLVALAGYMRILSPAFVRHYRGRLVNIHPSLLPSFPGLDAQGQAHAAGVRIAGCTTHFVTEEMDAGPIIMQAAVPASPSDDAHALAARILEAEHAIYPLTIHHVAAGNARLIDDRVVWRDAPGPTGGVIVSPGGA